MLVYRDTIPPWRPASFVEEWCFRNLVPEILVLVFFFLFFFVFFLFICFCNQKKKSVNARSFPRSNALFNSSKVINEQESMHRRLDAIKNLSNRSTTETIYLLWRVMEWYQTCKKLTLNIHRFGEDVWLNVYKYFVESPKRKRSTNEKLPKICMRDFNVSFTCCTRQLNIIWVA